MRVPTTFAALTAILCLTAAQVHAAVEDHIPGGLALSGNSIGLNFVGGRSGGGGGGTGGTDGNTLASTTVAGVVAQANWNNGLGSNNAGPVALVDQGGGATGATVSWSGVPNSWTVSGSAAADGDAELMNGYLDTNTSSTTTVEFSGITYKKYMVVVYYDGDGTSRSGDYTVNGTSLSPALDSSNWDVAGGGDQYDDATIDLDGNYLVFGPEATSSVTATSMAVVFRGPINGIQIVEVVPEPSTYLVFGGLMLCFGAAGWWRKRRSNAA